MPPGRPVVSPYSSITRWQKPEYDEIYKQSEGEIDPVKRAEMFIKMNELVIEDVVVIPIVYRPTVAAVNAKLVAPLSGWDNNTGAIKDWYKEA